MKLTHVGFRAHVNIASRIVSYRKAYLSAITVTNISQIFIYKMAAKTTGIDTEQNYVTVTLCTCPIHTARPDATKLFCRVGSREM